MRVMKYVDVIIPLRFRDSVTYSVPQELEGRIVPGSIVKVTVVGRSYTAVVLRVKDVPGFDPSKIIPLRDVVKFPPVTQANMDFLRQVASYYMCSLGEAFRFAAPSTVKALKRDKAREADVEEATGNVSGGPEPAGVALPVLSEEQAQAVDSIRNLFSSGKNVLLHGVTGSGKTEIYVTLADECLRNGRSVLCLVPEIALSRQIQKRLEAHFPDRLLVYHSKQTAAHKREVYERVASCTECSEPYVILGLRSALFLPYRNLGLIIVDEEHDTSYKQTDQAPRYHGRDTALMLGRIMHCPVLLGSATPSFESLYNVQTGRLGLVSLTHRYFGGEDSSVVLVDMRKERRKNAVKGPFSLILLKAMAARLERHEQVLIFRSRRAYASAVECGECGAVLKCPKCNIPLSYHKFNHSLSCHYCGYTASFPAVCPECGEDSLRLLGDGTEKIEETLHELFPEARIERFDADTTKDKREETRILKQFSDGKIDILVGTQMITKGFDFSRLTLTAVLKAEAVTSVFDFRADERALQLLRQLMGRAGRRNSSGEMIVQTFRAEHPVFNMLLHTGGEDIRKLMEERLEFNYPPFTRIIRISVKSNEKERLECLARDVATALEQSCFQDVSGPATPPQNRMAGEYNLQFLVKIDRSHSWTHEKDSLYRKLRSLPSTELSIDVDPVT